MTELTGATQPTDPAKADTVAMPPPPGSPPAGAPAGTPPRRGLAPGARIGPYEVLSELGRGGMGVVFRARDGRLGREVALKTLSAQASEAAVQRFLREARAAARVKHPGVVTVHEISVHDGVPLVALELVEGGSLQEKIARSGPCPPEEAARLVAAVARAVEAAHREGIVHRDLKPGNVLLDPDGKPRLADFGLARDEAQTALTATGDVLGSPAYMAPEQAAGDQHAIGPRTDVYGLGAVLYEALAGRAPFTGSTPLETLARVANEEPASPSRVRKERGLAAVPEGLEAVCQKALEKEPARRYESAEALALDLERYLRGEPVLAKPPGRGRRALRWARRQRALAALVLLVLGGGGTLAAVRGYDGYTERVRREAGERTIQQFHVATVVSEALARRFDRVDNMSRGHLHTLVGAWHVATERLRPELDAATARLRAGERLDGPRLRLVRLAVAIIGLIESDERSHESVAAYLDAETDERRAIEAANALAWMGRDAARVRLQRATERFGERSSFALRTRPYRALLDVDATVLRHLRNVQVGLVYGMSKEAREDARHIVEEAPRLAVAWLLLARTRDWDDWKTTVADTTRALELEPGFVDALAHRAFIRIHRDDDAAVADYTRALELDPRDATLWLRRGEVLGEFLNQHRDEKRALADFARAIELDPESPAAWIARGYAKQQSDPRGGAADLERALELEPTDWTDGSLEKAAASLRGR